MEGLSKDELIKLYETMSEDSLRKLEVYADSKRAYETKQEQEKLKKERIDKAITLVKEAQELLKIYRLNLRVTARGIQVEGESGIIEGGYKKREKNRISYGQKTHQSQYKIPILHVLIDLGGRGRANEVLERVYDKMKDILNSYDLEKNSSGVPRWNNTASFQRLRMVKEGLLKSNSPRGLWEITEKGRNYLKENLYE